MQIKSRVQFKSDFEQKLVFNFALYTIAMYEAHNKLFPSLN